MAIVCIPVYVYFLHVIDIWAAPFHYKIFRHFIKDKRVYAFSRDGGVCVWRGGGGWNFVGIRA